MSFPMLDEHKEKLKDVLEGDEVWVRVRVLKVLHNGILAEGKTRDGGKTFPPLWFHAGEIIKSMGGR